MVDNKSEASHNPASAANRRHIRVLYAIKFLTSISYSSNARYLNPIFKDPENIVIVSSDHLNALKPNPVIFQAIVNIGFGLISDKFGRKSVLNVCLLGPSLFMGISEFNKRASAFSFLNTLNSDFNCSGDIIKTIAVELSDKHSRPSTLVYLHIIEILGIFMGQGIGFTLSQCYPLTYPPITLIPCLTSASINGTAYILSRYYLNENRASLNMGNTKSEYHENTDKLSKTEQIASIGMKISNNSKLILIGLLILSLTHKGLLSTEFDWYTMMETYVGLTLNVLDYVYPFSLLLFANLSVRLSYPNIINQFECLKVYKSLFLLTPVLFVTSSILNNFVKIRYNHVVIIPLTILFSVQRGLNLFYNTSSNLLLAESSETTKNLATLYSISSALDNIADLAINSISSIIQAIAINGVHPFQLNYNNLKLSLLTTLSLTGYWISTKIKNI
jgi:MFS family permease